MFFEVGNGMRAVELNEISGTDPRHYIGIVGLEESADVLKKLGLREEAFFELFAGKAVTIENHGGFDMICLNMLNHKTLSSPGERVGIILGRNIIVFISGNISAVSGMLPFCSGPEGADIGFDRILSVFLEKLTAEDVEFLDNIELEISNLENALIASKRRNCVNEIISLRKRLLVLKRYYEQLLNVLDELQENESGTLHGNSLRYMKIYSGRVERLYHSVLNLRDYVTQVREAYQAEVDISLNNIMKIFTVITAIFLPLTLIVGWYGMNLKLPEFQWDFGYMFVIILSVAVVVFCLVLFKKHKWF